MTEEFSKQLNQIVNARVSQRLGALECNLITLEAERDMLRALLAEKQAEIESLKGDEADAVADGAAE
ncbi:hypothetical protein [Acuticoccus sediminis]|uniref:hypothetical protein n=1 Tax=Acuticoccus sediminis TaxID=2184697 RepID=UPI001CFDE724|nr:hypothetical protein [Acuticoccus sediminis]